MMFASINVPDNETRVLEDPEVARYRRQRHRERCGELTDGRRPLGQSRDQFPASPIPERAEHQVEPGLRNI